MTAINPRMGYEGGKTPRVWLSLQFNDQDEAQKCLDDILATAKKFLSAPKK